LEEPEDLGLLEAWGNLDEVSCEEG